MAKNKNSNNTLKVLCVILLILTLIFAYLYISTNTENNSLQERSDVLDSIISYQSISLDHIAKAQEVSVNLDDYSEKWAGEEAGSISEQRYLERYKEELDKFKLIIEEDNKFQRDNSDLLIEYLGINAEETVSANNLLYTGYEDIYHMMLDYE